MRLALAAFRARPWLLAVVGIAGLVSAAVAGIVLAPEAHVADAAQPLVVEAGRDADGDGLADLDEVARWGTDPTRADTDGDSLPDAWEAQHARADAHGRPCPDPLAPDAYRDCAGKGMTLAEDHAAGTDPARRDTDADGIPDAYEATHGMDPRAPDADADPYRAGLTNAARYALGARADRIDTACSGMTDARKAELGLDPRVASTGGSGVPDGYALHHGLDPRDPTLGLLRLDGDPDGLTVLEKALARRVCATPEDPVPDHARALDPWKPDSDGDGMPDAWELRYGLDPTSAADAAGDADGDGASNLDAYRAGACPHLRDCDGDGLLNVDELAGWSVVVDGAARVVRSDPLQAVSDGDRVPDAAKRSGEWTREGRTLRFPPLDPSLPDTDGDGIPDADEVARYEGVLDPTRKDTDGDGLADGEEVDYWTRRADASPERSDVLCPLCAALGEGRPPNVANADSDEDGIIDGSEVAPKPQPVAPGEPLTVAFPSTDPASPDTDADALPDAWEKRHARWSSADGAWDLDPSRVQSLGVDDAAADLDGDALPNLLEFRAGADPHDADTDDDALPDGWEHANGRGSGARYGDAPRGKGFEWLPRPGDVIPLSPTDAGDARLPLARYAFRGVTTTWTLADAHRLGVSPQTPASDGVPDLWKAYWWKDEAPTPDPDADGLSNAAEFSLGTSPLDADTDDGGLLDGAERDAGLDPLHAGDDAGDGDLDGDGLTNADELRVAGTRVDAFDTDRDGLLDGGDMRPDATLAEAFLAAGVLRDGERFLGERPGCALKWSCAGDGLPDAWKVRHGLDPAAYHPPGQTLVSGGPTLLDAYQWGRPPDWDEETDGPWWLGLDPRHAGTSRDLDGDGLDDLRGEDPFPLADRANDGRLDLRDRRAVLMALDARGPAEVAIVPSRIEVDASPPNLTKGAFFAVAGRILPARPGVPVLVQLGDAPRMDPGATLGVGFTDAEGRFHVEAAFARDRDADVPEGTSALFGRPPTAREAWQVETARWSPGDEPRLLVWSYAVPTSDGVQGGAAWVSPPLPVRSPMGALVRPDALQAGTTTTLTVTAVDGTGDAFPAPRLAGARLGILGQTLSPVAQDGANLTFHVHVPGETAPGPLEAVLDASGERVHLALAVRSSPALHVHLDAARVLVGERLRAHGVLAGVEGAEVVLALGTARVTARTDEGGAFDAWLDLGNATPGARPVEATFAGDRYHSAASARTAPIAVVARPRLADVHAEATLEKGGELRARLLSGERPLVDPLTGEPPLLTLDLAGDVTTLAPGKDGRLRARIPPAAAALHPLTARLQMAGNALMEPLDAEVPILVRSGTRITLDEARFVRGEAGEVRGTLVDALGRGVPGADVRVRMGDETTTAVSYPDGSFEARVVVPTHTTLGPGQVAATFAGTETLGASEAVSSATVLARPRIELRRFAPHDDATLRGHVTDDEGRPLPGALLHVTLDRGTPIEVPTREDGTFALPLPRDARRNDAVEATLVSPERGAWAEERLTALVLLERASRIEGHAAGEATPGRAFHVTVQLADEDGEPLADRALSASLGGTEATALTSPNGTATLALGVPANASLGSALLRVRYAGEPGIRPSEWTTHVVVRSEPRLTVRVLAAPDPEGLVPVEVALHDPSGRPLAREEVALVLPSDLALRVRTLDDGKVVIRVPASPHAPLRAAYAGSAHAAAATADAQVGEDAPRQGLAPPVAWPVAVGLAALALASLAAVVWHRRRVASDLEDAFSVARASFVAPDENAAVVAQAYRALVAALGRGGLVDAGRATPREVQAAIAAATGVPPTALEPVIRAFEHARYGHGVPAQMAAEAVAALSHIRGGAA